MKPPRIRPDGTCKPRSLRFGRPVPAVRSPREGGLMPTRIHRWLGVAGVVSAAAFAASPADAMTIRIGEPTLVGRVAMRVPVVVSCTPFDPSYTLVSAGASVSVQQASGKD